MPSRVNIRRILAEAMHRNLPDFLPMLEEKHGYWFRRPPVGHGLLYNVVLVCHAVKPPCLSADVYAGVLSMWDRQYGRHLLQRSTGLPNLRLGSQAIPVEESSYPYDGSESGAVTAVSRIVAELGQFAVPWFEEAERSLAEDPLVKCALDWLAKRWRDIPADVADQMDAAFRKANHKPQDVDHPLLNELKAFLRSAGQSLPITPQHRKEISILAIQTLEYAQERKRTSNQFPLEDGRSS